MKNKYWKYICLLGLGAFCWTCSDDNPNDGPDGPGSEGGQGTEQEIVRSYKIGTLAGFEGNLRQKMDKPSTDVSTMHNRSLFCRYVASAYPEAQDDQPYPGPITEADWWDNFVEEIAYSGQDYVAMNCRGEANTDARTNSMTGWQLSSAKVWNTSLKSPSSTIRLLHGRLRATRTKATVMTTSRSRTAAV